MKCDVCGKESEFEAAFIKERKSFGRSTRTVCPACQIRRRKEFEGWYQIAVMIGGIAGYVILWVNPWSFFGLFLTTLFLIDVFLILSIVPHELGHVIAGRLVGWRVFSVVIGIEKRLFKFTLLGIIFNFHILPVGGLTNLAPLNTRWFRAKRFIVFLAGPAVNAAIAGIILVIWRDALQESGFYGGLPRVARLCFYANLFIMAANLWPHRSKVWGVDTDGYQLLKTFSRNRKHMEELQAARYALEANLRREEFRDINGAQEWCNKGLELFPQNATLLNMSGILCLDEQKYVQAREIFIRVLAGETKPSGTRYMLLNNIAYVDALIGDPNLLSEADSYSKEALAVAAWVPAFMGTRGTVLVEMGQFEAGIKLLKESFEQHHQPRSKALNACHLAIAYCRMGNHEQAENYLKLAHQIDPQCQLIGRTEAELGQQKNS